MALSPHQLHVLAIAERTASVLSILGIATIFCIFCYSKEFRNPLHRIIFINAFFNVFDVVATTISLSGPAAGNSSALCQFQGFLMQMFPLTDVLWTLAMACNVFLIVFRKYEAKDLRKLEIKYTVGITALTFIPAVTFLFIRNPEKGPMYASVTLWCSVSPHWVLYRIIFFYGPVWLIVFITNVLYILVGIEILKQRRLFRSIANSSVTIDTISSTNDTSRNHFTNTVTNPPKTMVHQQPEQFTDHDGKESGSTSLSLPESSSHLHVSDSAAVDDQRLTNRSPVSFKKYVLMPLMFFVILLFVWVALTVNRVLSFIHPHFVSYPLLLCVGATGPLRGFWNGVVFVIIGLNVRKRENKFNRTYR